MDVLLINRFYVIRVFLSREPDKTLFEHVNFQRVETRYQTVDPQIKLEPVDQVRIRQVLRYDVAWLLFYFLLLRDYFYSFPATESGRLHNIHVFVVVNFAICGERPVVIREHVSLRAEVELCWELTLQSHYVLPHEVFAPDLERLGEVVDLLVL